MPKNSAFTLIELSIVLVIISLIVGGVIGGKSLLHSAKMQSVIKDLDKLEVAYRNFDLQYDSLPGDFRDMDLYFPTECVGRCDSGDGNGQYSTEETQSAFMHLSLADLIDGTYTAINDTIIDVNMMPTPIDGYFFVFQTGGSWQPTGQNTIGTGGGGGDPYPFSASSARWLDKKIDNGGAITGRMRWFWGSNGNRCHNNSDVFVVSTDVDICRFTIQVN